MHYIIEGVETERKREDMIGRVKRESRRGMDKTKEIKKERKK